MLCNAPAKNIIGSVILGIYLNPLQRFDSSIRNGAHLLRYTGDYPGKSILSQYIQDEVTARTLKYSYVHTNA